MTAQFRAQDLQRTPVAITAVNAEMMDARSQTSIYEVSAQAPSVTLKPQGAAFGPSLAASIRGVGQYDFNPAYEPGVGMYVDDVYYSTLTGAVFDLLDLERVEILRGPQGTLAGKNSIGGAVKLYSKKPVGDDSGYIQGTIGSRERLDLRASGDFAITDNIFARISGVSRKQEGYVDRVDYGCAFPGSGVTPQMSYNTDCVLAHEGEVGYNAMRAMLRFDNGGPVEVNVIGDYIDIDSAQAASVLIAANPAGTTQDVNPYDTDIPYDSRFVVPSGSYRNYASFRNEADGADPLRVTDGRTRYRGWGLSGQLDWKLGEQLSLVSISAYRTYDSGFSNDNDLSPLTLSLGDGTLDFHSFSQELRLNGAFGAGNNVEWTVGAFYMDQTSVYASFQDLRYSPLAPFQQDDPVDADNKSVFAHVNWLLSDQVTVVGGVRYTDESKDYTFSRRTPTGGAHPQLGLLDGVVAKYSGDRVDYRGTVQYQWNDAVMTYAQVSTGFKGGGVNPRPFFATQAQPFDPETLISYELGAKTELLDRRLRLNVATFFSDYQDIQLTANTCPAFTPTPSGGPCALPINAGNAEVKGVEIEANFQPLAGLTIDGSVSYLDFDYTSINPQAGGIDLTDVAPYTPEWKWSAGVQYEYMIPGAGSLTPRVDATYQDSVFTNSSNSLFGKIDDYTLANARLTWRSEARLWEVALEVTNLTDEYYFLTKFDQFTNGGAVNGQPGRPREWALAIKKRFE